MAATKVNYSTRVTVMNAVSAAESAPADNADGYILASSPGTPTARLEIDYTGTVSGTIRLYLKGKAGKYFRGDSYAMTGTDEAVDWSPGRGQEFILKVESISGGGSVTAYLVGVTA